jgi:hypothetical protein
MTSMDNKSTSKEQQYAGFSVDVFIDASMALQNRLPCQSFAERNSVEIYSD